MRTMSKAIGMIKRIRKRFFTGLEKYFRRQKILMMEEGSCIYRESRVINLSRERENIRIGRGVHIKGELLVYAHSGRIHIGDDCFIGEDTRIWGASKISIGNRVLVSYGCSIIDNTGHSLDKKERHEHFRAIRDKGHPNNEKDLPGFRASPIVIEDDVWISCNCIILKGVTIGEGAVIGAGCIISQDVPKYSVVHLKQQLVVRSNDQ